jgi:hypothetical protein
MEVPKWELLVAGCQEDRKQPAFRRRRLHLGVNPIKLNKQSLASLVTKANVSS